MILSSVTMGCLGVVLSFAPDVLLNVLNITNNSNALILVQILGALYFSFGILNWMTKDNLVGGIYNRPIVLANFAHYLTGSLALLKGHFFKADASYTAWLLVTVYLFFSVSFYFILLNNQTLKDFSSSKSVVNK